MGSTLETVLSQAAAGCARALGTAGRRYEPPTFQGKANTVDGLSWVLARPRAGFPRPGGAAFSVVARFEAPRPLPVPGHSLP